MNVKIAVSADTILYLPIYCLEHVHRPPGVEIEIDSRAEVDSGTRQLGDDGAYKKLQRGEADLCVCDPMVVLDEYKNHRSTIGVVVASLVTNTGLWGLYTPALRLPVDRGRSFIDQLRDSGRTLSNILTYDTASSAGHVVRYSIKKGLLPVARDVEAYKKCTFGRELEYLNQPLDPANGESIPELIVTCDLVGAIAAEAKASSLAPGQDDGIGLFNFAREQDFRLALFTGLIAHRGFLRNNREIVLRIVTALQEILSSFHANERLRWSMAEMLSSRPKFFPSLNHLGCTSTERNRFCRDAMDILKKDEVLARSVRISRSQWQRQAEIWEFSNTAKSFSMCTDSSIGAKADPPPLLRNARGLRRYVLPVLLPFALVVESFHGLAGLYHLYHWKADKYFWIILVAIVGSVASVLWLFGLRDGQESG